MKPFQSGIDCPVENDALRRPKLGHGRYENKEYVHSFLNIFIAKTTTLAQTDILFRVSGSARVVFRVAALMQHIDPSGLYTIRSIVVYQGSITAASSQSKHVHDS